MFRCCNSESMVDGSLQVRLPSNRIGVWIKDGLPGMSDKDLRDRVFTGWQMWQEHLLLEVFEWKPGMDGRPTQIITAHDFRDGAGGILADQQMYKPSDSIQRIDVSSARLSKHAFENMESHEHGHCAGFVHASPNDGVADLMDPFLNDAITGPQPGDIMLALKLGYQKAGATADKPVSPGDFIATWILEENGERWEAKGKPRKVA